MTNLSSLKAVSLAERNLMADARLPEDVNDDDPSCVASSDLCERSIDPRRADSVDDVVDVELTTPFRSAAAAVAALPATWSLKPLMPVLSARTNQQLDCA